MYSLKCAQLRALLFLTFCQFRARSKCLGSRQVYFLLETGLAYNWHRVYKRATGRYTQPDPLRFVDGPSVYGYAGGSPFVKVDREGLDWVDPMGNYYPDGGRSGAYVGHEYIPYEHPYVTGR